MSSVQVNFKVYKEVFDEYGYTDAYAVFSIEQRDGSTKTVTVTEYRADGAYYVFDFNEMTPDLFGDTITGTLYAKNNGKDYVSAPVTYSVLQYCNRQLKNLSSNDEMGEFRTLLVDLLNYGAASQVFTGHKIDALVNAGLTEEQKSWGGKKTAEYVNQQVITEKVDAPLAAWKGAGLVLEDAVTMSVTIEAADLEGLSVKVSCGQYAWEYDCVVDPEAEEQIFISTGETNRYKLLVNELPVSTMKDPVYFTVYKDGVAVSSKLAYSVQTYAFKNGGTGTDLGNLVDAMMLYGDAAYAFVN